MWRTIVGFLLMLLWFFMGSKALQFSNTSIKNVSEFNKIVGQDVSFDCKTENMSLSVNWLKNNVAVELISYRILSKEQKPLWKLELKELLLADSGDYMCTVTDGLVAASRRFQLSVTERKETAKPSIKFLVPNNISVKTGTRVNMRCQSSTKYTDAVPYMQWKRQRVFLLNDTSKSMELETTDQVYDEAELRKKFENSKYTIQKRNNTLQVIDVLKTERSFRSEIIFKNVVVDDSAEYSCLAFNEIGYSEASQSMIVYPVPKPTKLELAMMYAAKYGRDSSPIGIPLSVTVALPVSLVVMFLIGVLWWKANRDRGLEEPDPVTLLDIKNMRQMDNFSSMEHLGNCFSRVENKPFSTSNSEMHAESINIEEDRFSEEGQENQRLLANGNSLIQVMNPKPKLNEEKNQENIPMQVIASPCSGTTCSETPKTYRSSTMGSQQELEWEPVDLKLNVSASSKNHTSKGSDKSL